MAGKNKVYIEIVAADKGSPAAKAFDKNTERAFNNMKQNAKQASTGMGGSLQKLKQHWVAFSAGAVAAILIVRKAIKAVMANIKEWINLSKVQEKAEITLAAALKASGEYTDTLNKRYQEFASSIQKVTTYGDEQVLGLMALIKNLGVSTDKVEEATKMAIGLATATNRDVQSMAQYVALAMQGEFTMLRRYIPALRATSDATEQLKIVTEFAARGFKVAEETTTSYSDSLTQLRNLWSDLKEKLGDFITRNEAVLELIQRAKMHVTRLNEQLVKWYENNQAIINQKTHEAIDNIATAVNTLASALKALYKYRNVFKALFFQIPGLKELKFIKDIIDKIRPAKMEGEFGVVTRPVPPLPTETWIKPGTAPPPPGPPGKPLYTEKEIEAAKIGLATLTYELRMFQLQGEAAWAAYQAGADAAAKDTQTAADRLNAYRTMYGDIKSLAWANYDLQVELLKKQRDELLAVTGDMAAVSAWYAEKERELIIEKNQAILESTTSLTEGMAAAWENYILQSKSGIEELAEFSINISQTIAQGIGDAFAQAIVYGKNLSETFGNLMKSVAANIISSLIEIGIQRAIQGMIAQMLNLKEATSRIATLAAETYAGAFAATVAIPIIGPALAPGVAAASLAAMLAGAATAGAAGAATGSSVGVYHQGGIVGQTPVSHRLVPAETFAAAPRLHRGLGSDEFPAILQKGEEVRAADEGYPLEDTPILQVALNADGRELTKLMIHRTEIDGTLLNRLRKALA